MRIFIAACLALSVANTGRAVILWSDLGACFVHDNGAGTDMLGGSLHRDDTSSDTLYFKFHVDPISDVSTEEYFAAFQLYESGVARLGVGNSLAAWAYSAFNTEETGELNKVFGDMDLKSLRREASGPGVFLPYELPRRGLECTIVFKVEYVPAGADLVTVWMNPNLAPGATEGSQPEALVTHFRANASFNEIRLRHGGGGGGWTFSDMAIATSFGDFVSGSIVSHSENGTVPFASRLAFRLWQREQGLPQNLVRALAQTRDGYLWLGTDDGIARFDGVRFVSFGLREGLRSGPVRVLLEDSEGSLWIGSTGEGLFCRKDGRFSAVTMQDGLPSDSIRSLAEDTSGGLWVGTDAGLALCQNRKLVPFNEAAGFNGKAIATLSLDRKGKMLVGVSGLGLFRAVDGKFEKVSDASVEGLLQDPHCVLEDKAGRLWVGAGDDFVLCREAQEWHRYRIPRHLARPYVLNLAEAADDSVWAGSVSEGLFRFKAGKLTFINASGGLSDNSIESLLVDREDNVWVGTEAGLNRIRPGNLYIIGQNEGLGYGPVQGLAELPTGDIWAAKPNDGLYIGQGHGFSRLTLDSSDEYRDINSLLVCKNGSCWIGGVHGLSQLTKASNDGERLPVPELARQNVLSLFEQPDGTLWAGTANGALWRRSGESWNIETNFSQTHAITSLAAQKDGALWTGTDGGGLYCYRDQHSRHFDKKSGLLSNLVRALYVDGEGILWVGTAGGGLSRWDGNAFETFTSREGLPDNTISQILEDDSGRLWLGSNRGIVCVGKRDLEAVMQGKATTVYPQVYGRSEGMISEDCTGGFWPAGLKTKSGLLWFPTAKGLVVADPRPKDTPTPAPSVILEELLVEGTAVDPKLLASNGRQNDAPTASSTRDGPNPAITPLPGEVLRLGPGKRRLEFRYTGLSFTAPERIRFRYRLDGLDQDWVEAGTRRTAFYSYVPPGDYRFRVEACNRDGEWDGNENSLALTVVPYFWQARWFLSIAALGLLLSVGGAARLVENRRHRRRLAHLEQEKAVQSERARIAQDLHDDLGSSLTRITLLSDLVKADRDHPGQVEAHASKISHSAAQTVRALEEIVWALRPGSDSLQSLVEYIAHVSNELFEGDSAKCRLDLQHELPSISLPPEMRHNLFLIVKEALTNALKHAHAREVRVQAKSSPNVLELVVQDDGQGFDPTKGKAGEAGHHGLGNMRRRAEDMGGTLDVQSAPGKGTTVTLRVKFR